MGIFMQIKEDKFWKEIFAKMDDRRILIIRDGIY